MENDAQKTTYSVVVYPGKRLPEQYRNLIYARWKRSLRDGNEYFKLCEPVSFNQAYTNYIDAIFNREGTVIRLAVLSDDNDVCLGWSVTEHTTLHYVHVAHEQRRMGIAKALCPFAITTVTHLTRIGANIWNRKASGAVFNPFA